MKLIFATFVLSLALAGCSSIESSRVQESGVPQEGLVYYLPRSDVQVTVVKAAKAITTVTIAPTLSYPDSSTRYMLRHSSNPIGKSTLNVGITSGLLQSARSINTSQIAGVVSSLAGMAGTMRGASNLAGNDADQCPAAGTFTFIYSTAPGAEWSQRACGLEVSCEYLGIGARGASSACGAAAVDSPAPAPGTPAVGDPAYSGIYFRQNEPYRITVKGGFDASSMVFSPTRSPTFRLPVKLSFFADNDADFGFTDGVPTKYNEVTGGEVVALLQLPAAIVSGYFKAIGEIFANFKARDDAQASAMSAQLALELAKRKYDACILAIRNKDDAAIQQLGCGN